MHKDWMDVAMVVGWVSAWGALVYLMPTVGL
ncbi:membrane protein [Photobacterium swingsii]|nr:membrane protein [Photobacterium swingsii]